MQTAGFRAEKAMRVFARGRTGDGEARLGARAGIVGGVSKIAGNANEH